MNTGMKRHGHQEFPTLSDKRKAVRDANVCAGISSFTMLENGSYLEGVVKDVSDGGTGV